MCNWVSLLTIRDKINKSSKCLVVQTLDNAIYWINRYPADKYRKTNCAIHWIEIYPMDSAVHLSNYWVSSYRKTETGKYWELRPIIAGKVEELGGAI